MDGRRQRYGGGEGGAPVGGPKGHLGLHQHQREIGRNRKGDGLDGIERAHQNQAAQQAGRDVVEVTPG
jgi:hypothetical protein